MIIKKSDYARYQSTTEAYYFFIISIYEYRRGAKPPPPPPPFHNPGHSFIKVAYVYEPSLLIKVFTRLTDGITTDQQTLPGTVSARYIRFHPITQYEWNTLRVEVYKGELVVKRSVITCRIRKPDSDNVTKKE